MKSKKQSQQKCDGGLGKITGIYVRKIDSEKKLESYLYKEVQKLGGIALKYPARHHDGMLDRFILMPFGLFYILEMKSTGKTPSPLQKLKIDELRGIGHKVDWIDNMIDLKKYIRRLKCEQQNASIRYRDISEIPELIWPETKFFVR
jgi:hypothetical protein